MPQPRPRPQSRRVAAAFSLFPIFVLAIFAVATRAENSSEHEVPPRASELQGSSVAQAYRQRGLRSRELRNSDDGGEYEMGRHQKWVPIRDAADEDGAESTMTAGEGEGSGRKGGDDGGTGTATGVAGIGGEDGVTPPAVVRIGGDVGWEADVERHQKTVPIRHAADTTPSDQGRRDSEEWSKDGNGSGQHGLKGVVNDEYGSDDANEDIERHGKLGPTRDATNVAVIKVLMDDNGNDTIVAEEFGETLDGRLTSRGTRRQCRSGTLPTPPHPTRADGILKNGVRTEMAVVNMG